MCHLERLGGVVEGGLAVHLAQLGGQALHRRRGRARVPVHRVWRRGRRTGARLCGLLSAKRTVAPVLRSTLFVEHLVYISIGSGCRAANWG